MKRIMFITIACVLLLPLTGCWDQLELEEQAFVVVLGLDKGPDGLVSVTFQIANPQVGSSDKGVAQNEPPSDIVTFVAPDILSAKELANSVITRKISFAHLRTVIVSQSLAKSDLFHHVIGTSIRDPEMRRETNIIVCKEKASEFINANQPKLETRPHKYYQFMQQRWRDTGFVPYSTLNRYFQRLGGDTLFLAIYATAKKGIPKETKSDDDYIAGDIPVKEGDPVQIMGSAVFRQGRMIGTMTGKETRYTLFLRRKSLTHSFLTTFSDPLHPDNHVTVRLIKNGSTKIKINMQRDPIAIDVTLPLRMQLLSVPSFTNYIDDLSKQRVLQSELKEQIRTNIEEIVKKTQNEYEADPFLWHIQARKKFWTLPRYEAYDWSRHYSRAKVNVQVELIIESFGKQARPPRTDYQKEMMQ